MDRIEIDGRKNCLILPSGNVVDLEIGELIGKIKEGKFEKIQQYEKPNKDDIIRRIGLKKDCEKQCNIGARDEIVEKNDKELDEVIVSEKYSETKAEFDMYGRLMCRDYDR